MKSYVIHLIRNMPCEGNLEGRYIGRTESPAWPWSPSPSWPGGSASTSTRRPPPFTPAPPPRCVDTLKILYPQADPEVVLELAECDFGEWENKTAKELQNDPRFAAWMAGGGTAAPPGGESGAVFVQRVCQGFELLVKNLMAQGQTSAVLVTTAGVMGSLLEAYGLPQAPAHQWMCQPGCGYSVRITPGLWMRSGVMEVFAQLPGGEDRESPDHLVVDLAREAAQRAYGSGDGASPETEA